MKIKGIKAFLVSVSLLMFPCMYAVAVDFSNFPDINPYRTPKPLPQKSGDLALSCAQLDREISRITPYTYNYRPDFDSDPYVGTAIIAGATIPIAGYAFLGFRYVGDFQEDKRILTANARIEGLRRLKAEKFCYEDRG